MTENKKGISIHFVPDAGDSLIWALSHLTLLTVNVEVSNDGYPHERVVISKATDDGMIVMETDESGDPIRNATWLIPYEVIQSITIL
jgi:hypothetical protein